MSARQAIGVVAASAIGWFGYDVSTSSPSEGYKRSALALTVLAMLVGIQARAIIGWGKWAGD